MPKTRLELSTSRNRWLVSYADFMTLLFAFFVVMYSISHVNESKYRVLSEVLEETFQNVERVLEPIQVGEIERGAPIETIQDSNQSDGVFDGEANPPSTRSPEQIAERLSDLLSEWIEEGEVRIGANDRWLEVELKSGLLFQSGRADISDEAQEMLSAISPTLVNSAMQVRVEGHTDDQPIRSPRFPSNWELSSARSASVARVLQGFGLAPENLRVVGYGEFRPIADNATADGRSANRRVVLMVGEEAEERPLLSEAEVPQADAGEGIVADDVEASESDTEGLSPGVRRVQLESGGVLFTSDPD